MTSAATMFGGLDEDRHELATVARDLLERRPLDERAGAGEGWFGIGIPDGDGGVGGTLVDLAVITEAAGAAVAATGVPWTTGVIGPLLVDRGLPEVLARLSAGALPIALPVTDAEELAESFDYDRGGAAEGDRQLVCGELLVFGPTDGLVAVPVRPKGTPGMALIGAATGVSIEPVAGLDASRPLSRVTLAGVDLADVPVVADRDLFARWRGRLCANVALDAAGAARRALDRTLAYSVAREQFGRPIGSFQAYKHRCASAFVELKLAQSLAFRAADEIDTDPAQALAAGLYSTSAAVRVCGEAIQLHGGIGFSWEAGLHALLKRARMDQLLARGGAATARALLAAAG